MGVSKAKSPCVEFNLSERDVGVLRRLANGEEIKQIADELGRSPATVKFQVRLLRAELGARSLRHLVALTLKYGIVSGDEIDP